MTRRTRLNPFATTVDIPPSGTAAAPDPLTAAISTIPRWSISTAAVTLTSQALRLTFFTADKSITAANLMVNVNTPAAAATPTLCRMGIYSVAGNGDIALIASTPNDTTLFATTFTPYTKALSSSVGLTAGTRYAVGLLVVSAAAMPGFYGAAVFASAEHAVALRLTGAVTAQTDLPSTVAAASLSNVSAPFYARVS